MTKKVLRSAATLSGVAMVLVLAGVVFNGTLSAFSTPSSARHDGRDDHRLFQQGRNIFRFDTFGDQAFWGGTLKLHQAIEGAELGGVGPGVSPKTALALGLKVDAEAIPPKLAADIKAGKVDLDDPATTVALLKLNAVIGVRGFFDRDGGLGSIGITCAFCHSTVDDSFAPGIGRRLDGWPNRDLNVGAIVASAPTLTPYTDLLGVDDATVRSVLRSWGPGFYNAELDKDGKVARPDGKPAGTVIPPAFGLAGVNLVTFTGFGSIPYWNAYVAVTQMHGLGTFFDPRLNDPQKFPLAAEFGSWNVRSQPDLVSPKLPALQYYQLSLPAPTPPKGSFDAAAASRGAMIFNSEEARCANCHVPPTYSEPGFNMHAPSEICTDSFQADRSPDGMYRTTPLRGLFAHAKGGYWHDGRFQSLAEVVDHYDSCFGIGLDAGQKRDLVEFLKSR